MVDRVEYGCACRPAAVDIGSKSSKTRTKDQTEAAWFWVLAGNTSTVTGATFEIARAVRAPPPLPPPPRIGEDASRTVCGALQIWYALPQGLVPGWHRGYFCCYCHYSRSLVIHDYVTLFTILCVQAVRTRCVYDTAQ